MNIYNSVVIEFGSYLLNFRRTKGHSFGFCMLTFLKHSCSVNLELFCGEKITRGLDQHNGLEHCLRRLCVANEQRREESELNPHDSAL